MKKVTHYIQRKSLIYKTAVEYGDYTMNHIQGCSHGCKYPCYAFLMSKRFKKTNDYEGWLEPIIIENTLDLLDKELPRYKDRIKILHLCFTTDPFMYGYSEIKKLTLQAIKKINDAGVVCSVLTKGTLPSDLTEYSKQNEYGITLISLDESFRKKMEPGASPYKKRLASLKKLHESGCKTWVSIEPYPTPNIIEQDLQSILEAVSFTDKIIFGRTNYSKEVSSYKAHKQFFNEQARIVIDFCETNAIKYHIKKGTLMD